MIPPRHEVKLSLVEDVSELCSGAKKWGACPLIRPGSSAGKSTTLEGGHGFKSRSGHPLGGVVLRPLCNYKKQLKNK